VFGQFTIGIKKAQSRNGECNGKSDASKSTIDAKQGWQLAAGFSD
jgi:hypothetical protein